jgi:hypothetical protein
MGFSAAYIEPPLELEEGAEETGCGDKSREIEKSTTERYFLNPLQRYEHRLW